MVLVLVVLVVLVVGGGGGEGGGAGERVGRVRSATQQTQGSALARTRRHARGAEHPALELHPLHAALPRLLH